jgi:hypothetical protein
MSWPDEVADVGERETCSPPRRILTRPEVRRSADAELATEG